MPSFELVWRSPSGALGSTTLVAADAAAAEATLRSRGLEVLRCEPIQRGASGQSGSSGRAHRLDTTLFAQELSALLSAGLSVRESLNTLAGKETAPAARAALRNVGNAIGEGLPLSVALAREGSFPALLVATITASEQTGDIAPAMLRYAEHQLGMRELRDKVVGAAIYPTLLIGVGGLVVLFLLAVVVPRFALLMAGARTEMSWSSHLLMAWGSVVSEHRPALLTGLAVLLVGVVVVWRHAARQGFKSGWIERLPFIGPLARSFRHAQLYRTTGMLLRGGIAAPRALELSVTLLGADDQHRLAQAIAMVREGRDLSHALQQAGLADAVAVSMLSVAQRSGLLSEALERIAMFYEARLRRAIEVGSRLFEPLLMIFIGLVIGGIVVLMYLPIFDLASSLQ